MGNSLLQSKLCSAFVPRFRLPCLDDGTSTLSRIGRLKDAASHLRKFSWIETATGTDTNCSYFQDINGASAFIQFQTGLCHSAADWQRFFVSEAFKVLECRREICAVVGPMA